MVCLSHILIILFSNFNPSEGGSSKDVLQSFIEQLFNVSADEIIILDNLYHDSTECEIVMFSHTLIQLKISGSLPYNAGIHSY